VIFSISFSPSNTLLAVTSDKSTLHIFDIPHQQPARRSQSPSPASEETSSHKWGILGKIPLLPRVFSDVYSFANAHFEIGEQANLGSPNVPPIGSSYGRPQKGLIGWCDDHTLLVIGSGKEGRWEKFVIRDGEEGKRYCVRDGWKRYLG
jgi:hypothetical protein